jgi:hypothetical protein
LKTKNVQIENQNSATTQAILASTLLHVNHVEMATATKKENQIVLVSPAIITPELLSKLFGVCNVAGLPLPPEGGKHQPVNLYCNLLESDPRLKR